MVYLSVCLSLADFFGLQLSLSLYLICLSICPPVFSVSIFLHNFLLKIIFMKATCSENRKIINLASIIIARKHYYFLYIKYNCRTCECINFVNKTNKQ